MNFVHPVPEDAKWTGVRATTAWLHTIRFLLHTVKLDTGNAPDCIWALAATRQQHTGTRGGGEGIQCGGQQSVFSVT